MNEVRVEDARVFESVDFGQLTVVVMGGNPMFIAKEVADMLGYSETAAMTRRLEEEDKDNIPEFLIYQSIKKLAQTKSEEQPCFYDRVQTESEVNLNSFSMHEMTLITEAGLYEAIFGSKLPSAKAFKRWVFREVLPNIRKYGAHVQEKTLDEWLDDPKAMIKALTKLQEEREARKLAEQEAREARLLVAEKEQVIECKNIKIQADAPKVAYHDQVLSSEGTYNVTSIASTLGTTAIALNRYLKVHGIQYYKGGSYHLYKKHADKGYVKYSTIESNGRFKAQMRWTERGKQAIIRHYNLYN